MKAPELNKNDKKVLSALGRSEKPLSAYDILDRARSDALKAPVQVYRALEKLSSQGLVHRIEALNALAALDKTRLAQAAQIAMNDKLEDVRKEAIKFSAQSATGVCARANSCRPCVSWPSI